MKHNTAGGAGAVITHARLYDLGSSVMFLGMGTRFRSKVLDIAQVKAGDRFLDVGCGPGRLVEQAARRVGSSGEAFGVDLAPEMVRLATARAKRASLRAEYREAAAQSLPFDTGTFDVVATTLVVHHLSGEDGKLKAFEEMRRVLRDGGRVVIVDFYTHGGKGPLSHVGIGHFQHFGQSDMSAYPSMLEYAGFTDIETGRVVGRMIRYVKGRVPDGC